VVQKETVLKGSIFNQHDDLPFISTGKPDRVSQTLFGHFGGEKKRDALDVISSSGRTKWHHRLLLWTLSSEDPEMREHAWKILDSQKVDFDLLVTELSCPMWQVRVGVIRLLAKTGRLDIVRFLITGIEDYHPNVVEETKHSLTRLIDNAKIRQRKNQLPPEEVHDALTALYRPLFTTRRSPRLQAIQYLFQVAPLGENLFWLMYQELDLPQYTILHEEFIRYQREGSLEVLYRGLLQQNEKVLERVSTFLAVAVRNSGENVNLHLNAIRKLQRNEFVKLAFALQHYRTLVEFQGLIKHMNPAGRIILFDLLEIVGAEQNLAFLLRCLQLDDSRIRIRVLKILGESLQLGIRNEVFEFLTDSDEQVLLATLRYIQKKGDMSTLERISHLTRSKKKKVRQGVISTMFKIMKDDLLRKFDSFSHGKRMKILESLKKMKPTFFEEIIYLSESPDENDRIKYIKILEAEELGNALSEYRRMARDSNPKVRSIAVKAFSRIREGEARFKMIFPYLKDPEPRVRANAIEILPDEQPSNEEMLRIVIQGTRSDNLREKGTSIARMINWGYMEYVSELDNMLESNDEWTRTTALWILGVTDLPDRIYHLRKAANDKRAPVREMAVRGIGIKGTEEDLRALMPYLQDPELKVRQAAQQALRSRLHLSFEIA
jgi:HEAT repeat protein